MLPSTWNNGLRRNSGAKYLKQVLFQVLESCAAKLKTYLVQGIKALDISLDDYSEVEGSICQNTSDDAEQNKVHASDEHGNFLKLFQVKKKKKWLNCSGMAASYPVIFVADLVVLVKD